MKFEYSAEADSVIIDARDLASFARRKEGAPLFSPCSGTLPDDGRGDIALLSAFDGGDVVVAVRAVADLVSDTAGICAAGAEARKPAGHGCGTEGLRGRPDVRIVLCA